SRRARWAASPFALPDGGREPVRTVGPREDRHGVHRLHARVLLELQGGERAIGGPDLRAGVLHALEGARAGARRRAEALDRYGVGTVVAAALDHGPRRHAGDPPQQVAPLEADALRAEVAGGVVRDRVAGRALEGHRAARLVADRPEE